MGHHGRILRYFWTTSPLSLTSTSVLYGCLRGCSYAVPIASVLPSMEQTLATLDEWTAPPSASVVAIVVPHKRDKADFDTKVEYRQARRKMQMAQHEIAQVASAQIENERSR